ncbi:MAG: MFS transporter [Neisseriaceae bacterium]|nr:MFS transporter [Neisseriaceae bacterium]
MNHTTLNVTTVIDEQKLGRRQIMILLMCGLLMILDGFDIQAIGYVAPAIMQEWNLDKAVLGPIFGAGLFGLLLGSLIFSVASDKLGRRPVLIGTTFFFALCMLITPLASTVEQLAWIRFITGLGLGAIMPNTMALSGEITPKHQRISVMMLISGGFTAGALLGGLVAAAIIPRWGWESVFFLGGILPLLLGIVMVFTLPESLQFLKTKPENTPKIKKTLRSFFPQLAMDERTQIEASVSTESKVPFVALFQHNRTFFTLTIWLISLLNMIGLYFLSNWLPTLAKTSGFDLEQALLLGAMLQLGGLSGTVLLGRWIDKNGFYKILVPSFVLATCSVGLIGMLVGSTAALFATVFVAGFTVIGSQPAINALAANFYPTELRTTGVGWSLGIGRIGSVIGPVLGGQLVAMNLGMSSLFVFVAIPSVAIIAVLLIQKAGLKRRQMA